MDRGDVRFRFLLGFLTVLPLLILPFLELGRRPAEWGLLERYPTSDEAALEVGTLRALEGRQLLGPYSRFGWNHPGPTFFYATLPLYVMLGRSSLALDFTALFLNLAAIAVILTSVSYRGRTLAFGVFSVLFTLYLNYLYTERAFSLSSPWNPFVTILPFAALFFLSTETALGRLSRLPLAVLCASFVVQTHVAYLPSVMALAVATALVSLSAGLRRVLGMAPFAPQGSHARRSVALAGIVFFLLWLPPVFEELTNEPGNVTRMVQFFSAESNPLGIARALRALSVSVPFSTGVLVALSLSLGYFRARRRRDDAAIALSILGVVGSLAALWSIGRIVGPVSSVHSYLLFWTSALLVVAAGVFALGLVPRRNASERWLKITVAVVAIALTVHTVIRTAANRTDFPREFDSHKTKVLYRQLHDFLEAESIRKPLIRIYSVDTWQVAAGVILQLHKAGIQFSIQEDWVSMFGREFAPSGDEDLEVFFDDRYIHEVGYRYRVIARHRGTVLFVREPGTSEER